MAGRRERIRSRLPELLEEFGWALTVLLVGFGLAMVTFAVAGMVVAAAVADWRRVWLLLAWVPVWLALSGGVWLVGAWVFRPELLEGWRWPWQEPGR